MLVGGAPGAAQRRPQRGPTRGLAGFGPRRTVAGGQPRSGRDGGVLAAPRAARSPEQSDWPNDLRSARANPAACDSAARRGVPPDVEYSATAELQSPMENFSRAPAPSKEVLARGLGGSVYK